MQETRRTFPIIRNVMKPRFGMNLYNQLKRELGEIDASAECLELAMREFIEASKLAPNSTTFIQQLSAKHNVRVDVFDTALFVRRGAALRIIGVTQSFEGFLEAFIETHPRIQDKEGRKRGEPLLDFIVRKIGVPRDTADRFTDGLDYKLYGYYRQLRNGIVHQAMPTQVATASFVLSPLQTATHDDPRYVRLKAPNDPGALTFDDYVLFSRAAKAVAAQLCQIGGLSEEEIIEWLEAKRDRSGLPSRQANNVRTLLRIACGLDRQDAEVFVTKMKLTGQ